MLERERKFRITLQQAERIARALEADGVRGDKRRLVTRLYDHPQLALRENKRALRTRSWEGGQEITFKGPRIAAGQEKVREERTIRAEGDAAGLLQALGFVDVGGYETIRVEYLLANASVCLDIVGGDHFCEIEARDPATDLGVIATNLRLSPDSYEPRSYRDMYVTRAESAQETVVIHSAPGDEKPQIAPDRIDARGA